MAMNNIQSRLQVLFGSRAKLAGAVEAGRYVTTLHYPLSLEDNA